MKMMLVSPQSAKLEVIESQGDRHSTQSAGIASTIPSPSGLGHFLDVYESEPLDDTLQNLDMLSPQGSPSVLHVSDMRPFSPPPVLTPNTMKRAAEEFEALLDNYNVEKQQMTCNILHWAVDEARYALHLDTTKVVIRVFEFVSDVDEQLAVHVRALHKTVYDHLRHVLNTRTKLELAAENVPTQYLRPMKDFHDFLQSRGGLGDGLDHGLLFLAMLVVYECHVSSPWRRLRKVLKNDDPVRRASDFLKKCFGKRPAEQIETDFMHLVHKRGMSTQTQLQHALTITEEREDSSAAYVLRWQSAMLQYAMGNHTPLQQLTKATKERARLDALADGVFDDEADDGR